jgi:23S rRNA (adenine2503-C2)-methyltransferase
MPTNTSVKDNLRGMPLAEIEQVMKADGQPKYRAKQLFKWIHFRGAVSFDEMSDLPKPFRAALSEKWCLDTLAVNKTFESKDGTIKYSLDTGNGDRIEAVYMPSERRNTLCISTQVGCAMGCAFCLTGVKKLTRNLTAAEIVDQIRAVSADLRQRMRHGGEPPKPPQRGYLTNVVLMGMGEPLHNFEETRRAVSIMTDPEALGLSTRHVTVSTCGLIPEIERFGKEVTAKLAVSLNATTDAVRSELMPINRKYPLHKLMAALHAFPLKPSWRITFEYVLLCGVNDSEADARRLVKLVSGLPSKVNLIVYNPHPGAKFLAPAPDVVERFRTVLTDKNVVAFVRESRGADVAAACGQLGGVAAGDGR